MGKTPDDFAREIRELREETDQVVDELARRVAPGNVVRSVASTASHRAEDVAGAVRERTATLASDVGQAMPEQVRRNPSIVGGAALGLVASLGAYAAASAMRARERPASERMAARAKATAEQMGESVRGLEALWEQAREEINKGGRVQLVVRREEPGAFKRLAWVGLISVMGTLGAILFQRLTAQVWRRTLNEEPPRK